MLWTRRGGTDDGPLLVLLHGLGGTADVWLGVEKLLPGSWHGGWLAVDLPGHGRSPRAASYTFDNHAKAVAEVLPADRDLVLMGHSMGGMTALALAPLTPRATRVIGFSIKTYWPPAHVNGMVEQSRRVPITYATPEEAIRRYVRLSGMSGLVADDEPSLRSGVVEGDRGWQLAQDPLTYDFGVPDMTALLASVDVPVTLARGTEDAFVRAANLEGLDVETVTFEGLGHNPHVEDPAAVVALLG